MSNWQTKRLGDVCETGAGGTPLKSHKEYYNGGTIPWLMSGEVSQGEIYKATNFITETGLKNSSARLFPADTVLVAMYGATAGQVGILKFPATTNQAVCGILPNSKFLTKFVYYFFLSIKNSLVKLAAGNAQPNISQIKIKNQEIPIIPLPEQQRIVKILDEVFAAAAKAKENAEKNLANAGELFQSYLQSVFANPGKGWEEKKLGEIVEITSSKRIYKSEYVKKGIPFYRTKEIVQMENNQPITTELFISNERYQEIKKRFGIPKAGDILLSAIGTIGNMYIVNGEGEFYFKDGNILWLKTNDKIDPHFLRFILKSFVEVIKRLSIGSAYNALPIQKLNNHQLFLPSLKEQQSIVSKLDALSAERKKLEGIYRAKLAALEELKKSVLAKAFRGEL